MRQANAKSGNMEIGGEMDDRPHVNNLMRILTILRNYNYRSKLRAIVLSHNCSID